jgi:Fic family protein
MINARLIWSVQGTHIQRANNKAVTVANTRISGRYIQQPQGYRAFIPQPLPPKPGIVPDSEILRLLSEADRALGRLDGSIQTLPNPDYFVLMYVRKEAVLSSQIEGTQASLNDLLEAEADIVDKGRPGDVTEVSNYVIALNYGLKRLDTLPLSLRLIREIHGKLMMGMRGGTKTPGEFRTSQNWIGPEGAALAQALFVPPPPHQLPQMLGDFEKFLHADAQIPALIKIGLAHAQFETIHPFLDGNGRVGRLLMTFLLCQQKILQKPVLYLSVYLRKHRARYYELLQATRDSGDYESWLKFLLRGIAEVSQEATETARRIVQLRETHRRLMADKFGRAASNGLKLIDYMFEKPVFSVQDVAAALKITVPTANGLVRRFLARKMIVELTGNLRNRRFRYESYTQLFG